MGRRGFKKGAYKHSAEVRHIIGRANVRRFAARRAALPESERQRLERRTNPAFRRVRGPKLTVEEQRVAKVASMRAWRIAHPERTIELRRRRKLRERQASGFHTEGEWETLKKQYDYTCPDCGRREPDVWLTRDHIVPLSKGGSDNIENIQPLCKFCNCRKFTKIVTFPPIKKSA